MDELGVLIKSSVQECTAGEREAAVAFSGGLDSSLIAMLAAKCTNVALYTVGVKGAHDTLAAQSAAKLLGLNLVQVEIDKKAIEEAVPDIIRTINSDNPVEISYEAPLYFAAKFAKEHLILSGQGADELFGGYAKYTEIPRDDLAQVLSMDAWHVQNEGVLSDRKIAGRFEKELRAPFLGESVVSAALSIPAGEKIKGGVRKAVLRDAARHLGLPEEIAGRGKKAAQYGSGIMNIIKKLAKEKSLSVQDYISFIKNPVDIEIRK